MIPTRSDLRSWSTSRTFRAGGIFLIVCLLTVVGLAFKNPILVAVKPGEEVEVLFAQNYGIKGGKSKVKIGGSEVGVVRSVEPSADGGAKATLKIDESARDLLGAEPTAAIEPLTILGGEYSVNLTPGGGGEYDGTPIPTARTSTPVELDRILEALPADTRTALRGTVGKLDATLKGGGKKSLRGLIDEGADVLPPAGRVLTAARGTSRAQDLPLLVEGLSSAAAVLADREAAMTGIVTDLDVTSAALADERTALALSIRRLPAALASTNQGLADLEATLAKLDTTAAVLKPVAKEASALVDQLSPALGHLDPLLDDLDPLLDDARPATRELAPVLRNVDGTLRTLDGPVLDRVRGPILDKLGNTWRGKGDYKYSGGGLQADNKMYEELAYMITNVGRASAPHDAQGSILNFQASFGLASVGPLALDDFLAALAGQVEVADQ